MKNNFGNFSFPFRSNGVCAHVCEAKVARHRARSKEFFEWTSRPEEKGFSVIKNLFRKLGFGGGEEGKVGEETSIQNFPHTRLIIINSRKIKTRIIMPFGWEIFRFELKNCEIVSAGVLGAVSKGFTRRGGKELMRTRVVIK